MEWWSIFYKIRRTIFGKFYRDLSTVTHFTDTLQGVIAVASLLWAVVLSVYIARMWNHLLLVQSKYSLFIQYF